MFGSKKPLTPPQTIDLRRPEQPLERRSGRSVVTVGQLGLSLGLLMLVALLAWGGWIWRDQQRAHFFPEEISQSVTFPLFYPAVLPSGYSVDRESFRSNHQVVVFKVQRPDGKKLVVTLQPVPPQFDFDDFNRKKLLGSKEVITRSGKAVVGLYGDHLVASLVTPKTWVLVNSSNGVSDKDLDVVTEGLTRFEEN